MNYKLLIQYDGTDFHGWQIQEGQRTVQGELTRVLSLLEGANVQVSGSGRTDAGVHAEGQVASVKLSKFFEPEKLRAAVNGNLRRDVRVLKVEKAADDFHARFSATGKTYVYRIINAPVLSPFWARYAVLESRPLNLTEMQNAAQAFLGIHDWTAFSAASAEAENRVREITELTIETRWDARASAAFFDITVSAEGFLRYMVRSIVGTLLEVGREEKSVETVQEAILTGNRFLVGATAPAHGLTLLKVDYS
ncbi:MAG TPA: tRNA pseudouridine(38-40) synthase TruA [Pyrinomonadaceae bacterium]|nr:tRNA pseudouridine(38-40) synthase TruA [Pyrinomonadaceae bacterium]